LQRQETSKTIAFTCLQGYFDSYTFQQDNAPAHRACEMVEFLACKTPDLTPPKLLSADCWHSDQWTRQSSPSQQVASQHYWRHRLKQTFFCHNTFH